MFKDDIFIYMTINPKYLLVVALLAHLPLGSIAQKVSITGVVLTSKAKTIVFERLKGAKSWKVWKGSEYATALDSSCNFNLSFPIAESGYWKVSSGNKKSKIHLNVNQNVYLELDTNLNVLKILRQDFIDSPLPFSF